jgi:carbon monoxide dehydrogenase subunit G
MTTNLEITARIRLPAPAARVWQVALDWSRQHEWIWATQVSGGTGTGAGVTARTGLGPAGFTDTMVITEWDPPRRCTVRHTGRVVRGSGIFEVIAHGEQSEFAWTEVTPVPAALAGPLAQRMVVPVARWFLDSSLRRLARLI